MKRLVKFLSRTGKLVFSSCYTRRLGLHTANAVTEEKTFFLGDSTVSFSTFYLK